MHPSYSGANDPPGKKEDGEGAELIQHLLSQDGKVSS